MTKLYSNSTAHWSTRLNTDMAAAHRAGGRWRGTTLAALSTARAQQTPAAIAVIDSEIELDFSQVHFRAVRLATSLKRLGLVPGDVISFQLPNWHETMLINLAASMLGCICNPIVPIYRDAEVAYILADTHAKLIFIPDRFRRIDYSAMIVRLRPALPDLKHVITVRGFGDQFAALTAHDIPPATPIVVDPDAIKLLLYTSGTTGKAKGVLHSHNTLSAEVDAVTEFWGLGAADVMLMPSPVTHITGYIYALELPFATGQSSLLMDRWNADAAIDLIARHKVSISIGATPFLVELVIAVEARGVALPSLRLFGCGGAPAAPDIIERAHRTLPDCTTFRLYGSSEAPTVSLGVRDDDPADRAANTDGRIFGHEVLVVDPATGAVMPWGAEGEILTRGPEVMLGYTDPVETVLAFDSQGFFRTGDLGFVSADGFLTISGRKKDLIIRGGENLSAREVEDVLHRHPAIAEAAVVAAPHSRLGETPAAFIVLKPGTTLDLAELTEFLDAALLARQKFPESLIICEMLPRTPSGKVQKHLLRAQLAAAGAD